MNALGFLEISGTTQATIQCHFSEDLSPKEKSVNKITCNWIKLLKFTCRASEFTILEDLSNEALVYFHKNLYKDVTLLQEMTLIFVHHKTTYSRPGHSPLRTYPRKQNSFDILFIRFMKE